MNPILQFGMIFGGSFLSTFIHHALYIRPAQLKGLPPAIAGVIQSADQELIGKADAAVAGVLAGSVGIAAPPAPSN